MITNDEVVALVKSFLQNKEKENIKTVLNTFTNFIDKSEFFKREAVKTTQITSFEGFTVYKYSENFFSFEKILDSKIKIRIAPKVGDYTLAPHAFLLIPLSFVGLILKNKYLRPKGRSFPYMKEMRFICSN
ncbi:hypothetical protein COV61_03135, partial [Candidatus Micrarchaeota archaeon CG11_big_fil_rev_8_21_14_0_20_47_5]